MDEEFEIWAADKFGSDFVLEDPLAYFRMSAAYEAGRESNAKEIAELKAALEIAQHVIDTEPPITHSKF